MTVLDIVTFIVCALVGLGIGQALTVVFDLWNVRRKGTRHA